MTAISKRRNPTRISRTRRRRPTLELLEIRQLLSTYVVNNTNDGGPGSLRQAIVNSNGDTAQTNLITFNLGTSGIQTINILSALPAITQSVTIDGEVDSNGYPLVELNGAGAGSMTDGLMVVANDTTIETMIIDQFGRNGIDVSGNDDVIAGNDVGTDPMGTFGPRERRRGRVRHRGERQISRSIAGHGNVIMSNGGDGLQISGAGATGNVVEGNEIGGPRTLEESERRFGILVNSQASHNLIGTNGDGVNDSLERNYISGNASWGIQISGPGTRANVVAGNKIGTAVHGPSAVPNGGGGVSINDGATHNLIGTDGVSVDNAGEGNLISGNNGTGAAGDPDQRFRDQLQRRRRQPHRHRLAAANSHWATVALGS